MPPYYNVFSVRIKMKSLNVKRVLTYVLIAIIFLVGSFFIGRVLSRSMAPKQVRSVWVEQYVREYSTQERSNSVTNEMCAKILMRARELTREGIQYDPAYHKIKYPGGDVPENPGVCTDMIVRSFRSASIDLQKLIHEDKKSRFFDYPFIWHQLRLDSNIDHRRVPNLMTYFTTHHSVLPRNSNPNIYKPCDIVAWDLGQGVTHIGLISDHFAKNKVDPLVIHHIAGSPKEEDVLFSRPWKMIGHYRWSGDTEKTSLERHGP